MPLPEKGANRPDPMAFGRNIAAGLGVNILVRDVEAALKFQTTILSAKVIYWEDHFAVVTAVGSVWLVHSDWSYRDHELRGAVEGISARGAGLELRLYGIDPDACVARARDADEIVLAAPADKPHGLREAFILDQDGYVWVPSVSAP